MTTHKTLITTSLLLAPATALFQAGYGYAFSQNALPQLYDEKPHHSTKIFTRIFYAGAWVAIPGSLSACISSAFLAALCTSPAQRKLYGLAAVCAILPLPYTGVVMMPGIKRLLAIGESKEEQDKSEQTLEHRQLLQGWVWHNNVRNVLYLVSGGASLWAAVFG